MSHAGSTTGPLPGNRHLADWSFSLSLGAALLTDFGAICPRALGVVLTGPLIIRLYAVPGSYRRQ